MTRIPHYDFAPVEQQRMIESRPGGKARFERDFFDGLGDGVHFTTSRETKSAFARGQTAEQTDKPRREQREANRRANRFLPLGD